MEQATAEMEDEPTAIADLPLDALRLVFGFVVQEPTGLAQLCACACVSKAWRDLAYEPALWRSLTNWERLPTAELEGASPIDRDLVLSTLIGRSRGTLEHFCARDAMDLDALKVIAALRKFGCEGKLLSLEVYDVQIKADGSSFSELTESEARFQFALIADDFCSAGIGGKLRVTLPRTTPEQMHLELVAFMQP